MHRNHAIQPYRSPQLNGGELLPPIIEELESELDVEISIIVYNISVDDEWQLYVDGSQTASIQLHRDSNGYTVVEMTADEFCAVIKDTV